MAFIDELMKLQGNQMGRTPVAPFPATPQATPQAPQLTPEQRARVEGSLARTAPQGFTPELRDVFGNSMAIPNVPNVSPSPVDIVPSLSDPTTETRDLAGTGTGALIDTPSSGGFAGIEEGISEAVGQPSVPLSSAAPTEPLAPPSLEEEARPFDPNAALTSPLTTPTQPAPAQGLTTVGGMPLSQFLSGEAIPEAGLAAERPLAGRGLTGEAGRTAFEEASAAREQRAAEQFGVARGPDARDRDTGELSMADAVDLAGGDRDKARAMVVASRQAKEDTRTPEEIESDRLAIEAQKKQNQLLDQQIEAGRSPNATPAEKESAALAQAVKDGTITQAQADEAKKQKLLGKPPGLHDTWAEYEAATGTDADGDGKVSTEAEAAEAEPAGAKGKLDANTAKQLLKEAGGDKAKARQLAKERGYTL